MTADEAKLVIERLAEIAAKNIERAEQEGDADALDRAIARRDSVEREFKAGEGRGSSTS